MARQTRAQRRARRAEAQRDGARVQSAVAAQPPVRQAPRAEPTERRVPGGGAKRFVSESWAELKKVEWPAQKQLVQGVVVVLVACIVVGLYLYANDRIWAPFVKHILLR